MRDPTACAVSLRGWMAWTGLFDRIPVGTNSSITCEADGIIWPQRLRLANRDDSNDGSFVVFGDQYPSHFRSWSSSLRHRWVSVSSPRCCIPNPNDLRDQGSRSSLIQGACLFSYT